LFLELLSELRLYTNCFFFRKPNRITYYYFAFSIKENIDTLALIAKQTILISLVFAAFLQAVYNLVFGTKNT
jgi:hypothetical protein